MNHNMACSCHKNSLTYCTVFNISIQIPLDLCKKEYSQKFTVTKFNTRTSKSRWSNFCTLVGYFSKLFELAGLSWLEIPIFVPKS